LHHLPWPSDITFWVNGVDLGFWTSPGDFGGQRGLLTPEWWEAWNTQYGLMKLININGQGTYVDGVQISGVTINELRLTGECFVRLRVGVKADAGHVGGVNLFGRSFGNYPQDIMVKIRYE
jgi:predicted transcriptional regulator